MKQSYLADGYDLCEKIHIIVAIGSAVDPLSEILSMLDVKSARCTRFEAGGGWSFSFPPKPALKFGAVLRGACWLNMDGGVRHDLAEGDAFLLANAPGYVLTNDNGSRPEDGIKAFDWEHSDVAHHEGSDTVLIAGSFSFEPSDAGLLIDSLPTFLRIPSHLPSSSTIRSTLQILDEEIRNTDIGAATLTDRLADVLLVQVLRAALVQSDGEGFGWIGALADPRIGQTIRLMHTDAARTWTVDELASAAAMSRSAFSRHFRLMAGYSPLDYLLRWRMRLARDRLKHGSTVAEAAFEVGYASESAFGNAFKRVYGRSPKRYWNGDGVSVGTGTVKGRKTRRPA